MLIQIEELRQKNRSLRHQLNLANQEREKQSKDRERALSMWDKAHADLKKMLNEMEIIKEENNILRNKLDQSDLQVVCIALTASFSHNNSNNSNNPLKYS